MVIEPLKKVKNFEVGKEGVIEIIVFNGMGQRFVRVYFDDGTASFEDGKREGPSDDFDLSIFKKHNIKV